MHACDYSTHTRVRYLFAQRRRAFALLGSARALQASFFWWRSHPRLSDVVLDKLATLCCLSCDAGTRGPVCIRGSYTSGPPRPLGVRRRSSFAHRAPRADTRPATVARRAPRACRRPPLALCRSSPGRARPLYRRLCLPPASFFPCARALNREGALRMSDVAVEAGSPDAPVVSPETIARLRAKLNDPSTTLCQKYRVLFSLRNVPGENAHEALIDGASGACCAPRRARAPLSGASVAASPRGRPAPSRARHFPPPRVAFTRGIWGAGADVAAAREDASRRGPRRYRRARDGRGRGGRGGRKEKTQRGGSLRWLGNESFRIVLGALSHGAAHLWFPWLSACIRMYRRVAACSSVHWCLSFSRATL